MSTKEIRCIYCKGVHTSPIEKDLYICEYCGGLNYITTSEEDFNFQLANNNLSIYKFDEADDIYKKIIDESTNDKTTSMAIMGRLLSYFGIVYVKSYGSNVTTPTFSKYNPDIPSIKSCRYYKQLCNLDIDCYELQKYKTQIEELDKVYTRIDNDLNDTPEYDVFICTKISMRTKDEPNNKGYTEDSRVATDIYYTLKEKGLKVFYSDKVLKGVDYDSQIYSALSKSKTILVIASKKEYLESVWVESEWRRWLNFIDVGFRKKDTFLLHLIEKGIEVPSILQKAQVIDYYKIYDVIDCIVNKDKKNDENAINILTKEIEKLKETQKNENKSSYHVHSYITTKVNATCLKDGYNEYKCVECGYIKTESIPKLNHNYVDGKCTMCGDQIYSSGLAFKLVDGGCSVSIGKCKDKNIVIPKEYNGKLVTEIAKSAFYEATFVESVKIPEGVTKISDAAFSNCTSLKNIIIPNSVTSIGVGAFVSCHNFTNVYIPDSVTIIEDHAFSCCNNLKSINVSPNNKNYKSIDGNLYTKDEKSLLQYAIGKREKNFEIPNSVTSIGGAAFQHSYSLINLVIPNSVTSLGGWVFSGCPLLTNVEIPDSITSISDGAFANCPNLTSIYIPKSVKEISTTSFYESKQLTVYCEIKKPLFGYPKGYNKECFEYVRKVKWNYKK